MHCLLLQGWEGLADSVVGAVTVFYFALLTNRAFQMTPTNWRGNSVKCVTSFCRSRMSRWRTVQAPAYRAGCRPRSTLGKP